MKHLTFIKNLMVILFIAGIGYSGSGQIPKTFSFQAVFTDNSGNPVPDGTYNVSLSFYTTLTGGLPALTLDQETISVSGGLANIVLGGQAGLNLPIHSPLYVGLSFDGNDEMTPRMPVIPSFQSQSTRNLFGDLNIVPSEGNVGIGTKEPVSTLDVNGHLITNELSIRNISEVDIAEEIIVVNSSPVIDQNITMSYMTAEKFDALLKERYPSHGLGNDFSVLNSSGSVVFNVVTPTGNSHQKGSAVIEGGIEAGLNDSYFYASSDEGFGFKKNNADIFTFEPSGLASFDGGLQVGTGSSYLNVDQSGTLNITGESGTALTLDPNGTNFLYNPTSIKNDLFAGETDTSYFLANKSGSFGSVLNGQWGVLFDPHGNSVINTPLYLNPGMIIGSDGSPYTSFFNDGTIWRDAAGAITAQILADGSIQGTSLNVTGEKEFKIDHPLDPENKYLLHRSIESNDRLNLYNGNIILNKKGEAEVELPAWFGELNEDYRYQLTAIGAPAPNLYIAKKIENNKFKISGGTVDMEVSWQVSGKRKDKYANGQPALVEVLKESPELSVQFKME